LLGSVLVHAGVLYFLAAHLVSVKIIKFETRVTPVLIVPPPPLELPERARDPANLPAVIEGFPEFLPGRTLSRQAGQRPQETPVLEEPSAIPAIEAFEPKFSAGFGLDRTPPQKAGLASADKLRLPIRERKKGPTEVLARVPAPPRDVDWRKYLSRNPPGTRLPAFSRATRGRHIRGDLTGRTATSSSVKKYNLTPWASRAVEAIQKNWDIPPSRPASPEAAVEIVIVLQKSGQISDLEVVASSMDRAFDQAARFAIELSSPLPPLPDDFPAASLEISLVFSIE